MIYYSPIDGDPKLFKGKDRPRTCFIMTKLGKSVPNEIKNIRRSVKQNLDKYEINEVDAASIITGKDFLLKIWNMIVSVPMGIAIINEQMTVNTYSNIFYEIGMLQAYGRETLIIKTPSTQIPSDFVRTEYLNFDDDFDMNFLRYLETVLEFPEHYKNMSDQLEKNPLLSIDFLKRAYFLSGDSKYRIQAKNIFENAEIGDRAKNSVEMLLADF